MTNTSSLGKIKLIGIKDKKNQQVFFASDIKGYVNLRYIDRVIRTGSMLLAAAMLFLTSVQPVYADRTISQVQQERAQQEREKAATESLYNEVQGELGSLQEEQAGIQAEIEELDAGLVEIIASVALMEEDILVTQGEIEIAQQEYDAAKAQEEAQYAAMKKRIKYLYEKGDKDAIEALTQAAGWSEMLNQATYVEKLYEYDRKMLLTYIALKEEVAFKKSDLESIMSELEAQKQQLEEEQMYLNELLAERKEASADYAAQISRAKQEAAAYKAQIKQQNAAIKKLMEEENAIIKAEEERRKREEEARRKAEAAKKGSSSSGGSKTVPKATGSGGAAIAQYACQFVGNPYVLGGTSLTNGADCSGFIQSVYRQYGYNIPRTSIQQRSAGREVSSSEAQPGDIICYAGHVALYLGNGRIVHASNKKDGIKYGYATYRTILTVRRIV